MEDLHIFPCPLSPSPAPPRKSLREPLTRVSAAGGNQLPFKPKPQLEWCASASPFVGARERLKATLSSGQREFTNCLDESFVTDGPLRRTQSSWIKHPQRLEVKKRVKKRTERDGRMVLCLGRPNTHQGSNTSPCPTSLTMRPHTESSASLSSLLSRGPRQLPHSWGGAERAEELSLPWKTRGSKVQDARQPVLKQCSSPDQV